MSKLDYIITTDTSIGTSVGTSVGTSISDYINTSIAYAKPEVRIEYVEKYPNFEIKKVHFNDPATIVLWADGTKTVVKCGEEDIYDPQTGLLMCMAKKMYGNTGKFNDILRKWVPEPDTIYMCNVIDQILGDASKVIGQYVFGEEKQC